jgi:hypothetical protein
VPDKLNPNKEYKVVQVEEETVLVEIRGIEDGAEAWRTQKSLPVSNFQARIDWPFEEVSAPALAPRVPER